MSSRRRIVFITGTDTGVGKTVLTVLLLRHLRANGVRVAALKPFCSGGRQDAVWLRRESGNELPLDVINPHYFRSPVSPAAALLGKPFSIHVHAVATHIRSVADRYECTLVEGAGGVLVPLGGGAVIADLIQSLDCSVLLVGRDFLGTLNHTLLSFSELKRRGRTPAAIVLMKNLSKDASQQSNSKVLSQYVGAPSVVSLPKLGAEPLLRAKRGPQESFLKKAVAKISALGIVCPRRTQRQQTTATKVEVEIS